MNYGLLMILFVVSCIILLISVGVYSIIQHNADLERRGCSGMSDANKCECKEFCLALGKPFFYNKEFYGGLCECGNTSKMNNDAVSEQSEVKN